MYKSSAKRTKRETASDALFYDCDNCNEKFVSKIECDEHRIRSHNQTLNVLPVEVFEHIVGFLHPNDLVEMSETCRKYKALIAAHFERERKCGWVDIISKDRRPKFDLDGKEKYEIYFRSTIRNIVMRFSDCKTQIEIFQFVKGKCSKNIRSLILIKRIRGHTYIMEDDMKLIEDQVKHLDVLAIDASISVSFRLDRFNNIRVLYNASDYDDRRWLANTFPNLQILCLSGENWNEDLANFMRNNTKIKTFCCDSVSAIESVMCNKNGLSNAVRRMNPEYSHVDTFEAIEKYYNNIPSFELHISKLDQPTFRKLAQLEKLKGLHVELIDTESFSDMDVEKLPQIQHLCVYLTGTLAERELFFIVKHFPNLTELRISFWILSDVPPNKVVSYLVAKLMKLKHLYIEDPHKYHDKDMNNCNEEQISDRLSMENVSNVIVYVDENYKSNFEAEKFLAHKIIIKPEKYEQLICPLCSGLYTIYESQHYLEHLKH